MVSVNCWGGQKKIVMWQKKLGKLMVFGWLNYFSYFLIFIGLFLFLFFLLNSVCSF